MGFWKYAQEDPGLRRDRRPRRHRAHRRRRARAREPGRARAARRSACSPATRSPRCCPNGSNPMHVYLAALQAGFYYVPINYRLSAARDRVHPAGLRREGVHQPRALRRPRRARPPTRPASPPRPGSRTARSRASASFAELVDRAADRRCPRTASTGAAMHYTSGTTGKPKGVKRALAEHRPRHRAPSCSRSCSACSASRTATATCTCARRPTTTPRSRRSRATRCTRSTRSCSWTSGIREEALRAHRAVPLHAHAHGADAVHPHAAAPRRREARSTTCRR